MLVISRKNGQKIMINDNIVINVVECRNGQVKLAFSADNDVKIYREEIYYQVKLANLVGKNTNVNSVESVSDLIKNEKVVLNDDIKQTSEANEVPAGKVLLDIGEKSVKEFVDVIKNCKTLIWNGPVGAFELKPFDKGTNDIAAEVAKLTKEGKLTSVAGGGDTVSALKKAGAEPDLTYVSAAGGAFLEWMEGKSLPGVAILEK